ncbi:MAG: DUF502 domain-containing protein [Pseudomonadales bacterium]|nr:DUF502 domain-containing protein [Pseudomonadales bacterium]
MIRFLRTTIAGGILFLVPFVIIAVLVEKALEIAVRIVAPIESHLPIHSLVGLEKAYVLAGLVLLLLCFLAGNFAKTSVAKATTLRFETAFLNRIPGYLLLKTIAEEIAGGDPSERFPSVLVRLDDAAQYAFLVEENREQGYSVVFVPGAPSPASGDVLIVSSDRVIPLDRSTRKAISCLQRMGLGSDKLVGDRLWKAWE